MTRRSYMNRVQWSGTHQKNYEFLQKLWTFKMSFSSSRCQQPWRQGADRSTIDRVPYSLFQGRAFFLGCLVSQDQEGLNRPLPCCDGTADLSDSVPRRNDPASDEPGPLTNHPTTSHICCPSASARRTHPHIMENSHYRSGTGRVLRQLHGHQQLTLQRPKNHC